MSKAAENMLVDSIISAARSTHVDRMLDAEQRHIIGERSTIVINDNIEKAQEIRNLNSSLKDKESALRQANDDKKRLNYQMREAMRHSENNAENAQAWMDVLRGPLHEIARVSPDFAKTYNKERFENAKVFLQKLVNEYATRDLANRAGMSEDKLIIYKCNIERAILNNDESVGAYKIDNIPELKEFHDPLISDYEDREQQYVEIIKEMKKSAKTFK